MKKPNYKKKKKGTRKKPLSSLNSTPVAKIDSAEAGKKDEHKESASSIPAKTEPVRKKDKKESVFRYFGVAGQFLREAKVELKKVKWPTRKELLASTAVVIVLVLVMAIFLGLIDFGLIKIIKNIVG